MQIMKDIWGYLANNPWIALFGTTVIIQISPIRINPWSTLMTWIRKMLVGDLENTMLELKRDFEEEKVSTMRWNILDFANSCRNDRKHTKEEWQHVISQLKEYEVFIEERKIDNGVIEEEAKYLRMLYAERNLKNDFL